MNHLVADQFICPHCGNRFTLEYKTNLSGDNVARAVCPITPAGANPLWSTDWYLIKRA